MALGGRRPVGHDHTSSGAVVDHTSSGAVVMDNMLVGIDGSPDSRAALRWAATVARARGLPLHALWSWEYPSDAVVSVGPLELGDPEEVTRAVEAEMRAVVEAELGEAAADVTLQVGRGPAAAALLRAARNGTVMIVVGSRGLGGFKGLLLGSVSRQLCEHAPCPVTVLRRGAVTQLERLNRIVVGIDGSEESLRALRAGQDLATRVGAELIVANVVVPGPTAEYPVMVPELDEAAAREQVEQWCRTLAADRPLPEIEMRAGDARNELLQVVRDRSADLLVVGSRGHGPVGRLLLGSVATWLVGHSDVPVTVVPDRR
ncbi:MAG: universal stress protein [Nitriliruptor sp.]|nr:MAG: universal stress protein [Nitriliruptor sp.]